MDEYSNSDFLTFIIICSQSTCHLFFIDLWELGLLCVPMKYNKHKMNMNVLSYFAL